MSLSNDDEIVELHEDDLVPVEPQTEGARPPRLEIETGRAGATRRELRGGAVGQSAPEEDSPPTLPSSVGPLAGPNRRAAAWSRATCGTCADSPSDDDSRACVLPPVRPPPASHRRRHEAPSGPAGDNSQAAPRVDRRVDASLEADVAEECAASIAAVASRARGVGLSVTPTTVPPPPAARWSAGQTMRPPAPSSILPEVKPPPLGRSLRAPASSRDGASDERDEATSRPLSEPVFVRTWSPSPSPTPSPTVMPLVASVGPNAAALGSAVPLAESHRHEGTLVVVRQPPRARWVFVSAVAGAALAVAGVRAYDRGLLRPPPPPAAVAETRPPPAEPSPASSSHVAEPAAAMTEGAGPPPAVVSETAIPAGTLPPATVTFPDSEAVVISSLARASTSGPSSAARPLTGSRPAAPAAASPSGPHPPQALAPVTPPVAPSATPARPAPGPTAGPASATFARPAPAPGPSVASPAPRPVVPSVASPAPRPVVPAAAPRAPAAPHPGAPARRTLEQELAEEQLKASMK